MNPAEIPFWGWLLIAVGCGILWLIFLAFGDNKHFGGMAVAMSALSVIAGIVCLCIAAIRFIKWVWAG